MLALLRAGGDDEALGDVAQAHLLVAEVEGHGEHGVGDAVTHALAKPDARPDKIQRWAEHNDARTTQRYNRRKELLDDSPGYGLGGALEQTMT